MCIHSEDEQLRVPSPMQYPDYRVSADASPRQLRQMAVKAMEDMLSIQWTADHYLAHKRQNPKIDVTFEYHPGQLFAGTPYCNAGMHFVAWFEFYDTNTGVFSYPGDGEQMNKSVSTTCARSVIHAWYTVANSITDPGSSYYMNPYYNYIPVGGYRIDPAIQDLREYQSDRIIADNGHDVMLGCLSQVQMADTLVTNPGQHVIMAKEDAYTVYRPDGSIDPEESYIIIQDQRGGKKTGWYERDYNGVKINATGRVRMKYTFAYLLQHSYIPFTCAEFQGTKPYEAPWVTCKACKDIKALETARLESNYPMPVIKLVAEDESGNQTLLARVLNKCLDRHYDLSGLTSQLSAQTLAENEGKLVKLIVTVPNAQRFTPVSFVLGKN